MNRLRRLTLLAMLLVPAGAARGGPVVHLGSDAGAGPGVAAPNSAAAEASFTSAVGTTQLIDFEQAPLGDFSTLDLGSGVSATLAGTDTTPPPGFRYGISDDNPNAAWGYNTTPGGSRFVRLTPELGVPVASLSLRFERAVDAVALTITGLGLSSGPLFAVFGPGPDDERLIDGSSQGGRVFFGLSGLDAGITELRLELRTVGGTSRDALAVDDLRFHERVASAAVPEPATIGLAALGLAVAGAFAARRRRRAG
jgi:hypothetical protein